MTRFTVRSIAAAASLAASVASAGPLSAQGIGVQFVINDIRAATPSCRQNAHAPWIGRVSGYFAGRPSRAAAFVGCFARRNDCEVWRLKVAGTIPGRLIYNACEAR